MRNGLSFSSQSVVTRGKVKTPVKYNVWGIEFDRARIVVVVADDLTSIKERNLFESAGIQITH